MSIDIVIPWETPEWDVYVSRHPGATVYHSSPWCRLVSRAGHYRPLCLLRRTDGEVSGLLPAMEIRSRLTGNRMGALPFSDECPPLARDDDAARELIETATRLRAEHGLAFFEMRGAPVLADGTTSGVAAQSGFSETGHFYNYRIPLSSGTDAIFATFKRKSVRQMITKAGRLGTTARRVEPMEGLREFYHLYVLNRRRHGIPPQPRSFFRRMLTRLTDEPSARMYFAEYEGKAIAALIVVRFKGVAYAKYEGVDDRYRRELPVYPLFWESIQDAAAAGDAWYDLGRTASDNDGLNTFKSHWGTEKTDMPYLFHPGGTGLSVTRNESWKYRLFTGTFRRLPNRVGAWVGARIFRHFG